MCCSCVTFMRYVCVITCYPRVIYVLYICAMVSWKFPTELWCFVTCYLRAIGMLSRCDEVSSRVNVVLQVMVMSQRSLVLSDVLSACYPRVITCYHVLSRIIHVLSRVFHVLLRVNPHVISVITCYNVLSTCYLCVTGHGDVTEVTGALFTVVVSVITLGTVTRITNKWV